MEGGRTAVVLFSYRIFSVVVLRVRLSRKPNVAVFVFLRLIWPSLTTAESRSRRRRCTPNERGEGKNEKKNEYAISTTVMDLERAGPAERARDTGVSRRWPSFEYHKNKRVGGDAADPRSRTARQTRFRRPGATKTVFVQFCFLLLPIFITCMCEQENESFFMPDWRRCMANAKTTIWNGLWTCEIGFERNTVLNTRVPFHEQNGVNKTV